MITDKPERLDARAAALEAEAQRVDASELATRKQLAAALRVNAGELRQEAARLRKRRTDGVRFG